MKATEIIDAAVFCPSLDDLWERVGGTPPDQVTNDELKALVTRLRSERVAWVDKQAKKGKDE